MTTGTGGKFGITSGCDRIAGNERSLLYTYWIFGGFELNRHLYERWANQEMNRYDLKLAKVRVSPESLVQAK